MDGMSAARELSGPGVQPYRFRADFPPGTVVFLIGMRVNELRRVDQWLPVFSAMPKMIRELMRHPEMGLLHIESWGRWRQTLMVQYWRDMDSLMRYATARDSEHLPAWAEYNRRARNAHAVGIWHEAYEVHPETSHIVYRDMPLFGMGKATTAKRVEHLPTQPVRRREPAPGDDVAASA
jgi:hypothetical protein